MKFLQILTYQNRQLADGCHFVLLFACNTFPFCLTDCFQSTKGVCREKKKVKK